MGISVDVMGISVDIMGTTRAIGLRHIGHFSADVTAKSVDIMSISVDAMARKTSTWWMCWTLSGTSPAGGR